MLTKLTDGRLADMSQVVHHFVRVNLQQDVRGESLVWASLVMLVLGNFASTMLGMGLFGGVMAMLGILAMVAGLVMMGDPVRDEME